MKVVRYIALISFIARLAAWACLRTSFVPDEYWQTIEPAHKITFGYDAGLMAIDQIHHTLLDANTSTSTGDLTWEWIVGIRNTLYPMLIAGLLKMLAALDFDDTQDTIIIAAPQLMQGSSRCILAMC